MSWPIGMPNLGHTMQEGLVQEWCKKPGDPVSAGEVIAIVESDKASFDIESPADGVLLAIDVPGGQKALVGARIGLVGKAGELVSVATGVSTPETGTKQTPPLPLPLDSAVRSRTRMSPAARALAEELGIDVADIQGSGDDGMVTRDDVKAYAATRQQDARQPLSPMRQAIANATVKSWNSIPHVALQSRAVVDAMPQEMSLTAAVIRASALALCEFPALNGCLHADGFEAASGANVGVAVAKETGLVTVVLHQAQAMSVQAIGEKLGAMAESARSGILPGAHTLGASFTVSSLGRWGVDNFAPIISAPQVAILGVGRVDHVARPDAATGVRFCRELPLTLVFDHRANDGLMAARFLAVIVKNLEQPERLEIQ